MLRTSHHHLLDHPTNILRTANKFDTIIQFSQQPHGINWYTKDTYFKTILVNATTNYI